MSCLDDDAQGDELEVLWEREVDAELRTASWQAALHKGFDDPKLFSAWLHTLRWNCVTSTRPELFQAPWRAGIEVKAYQLEPLRKALRLPRVNLFIADDVGLGKTIEAGLIVRELLMRQKVRRVVICAPPSVVVQWREEMESRFGLGFIVLDREYVAACRRERGFGVNPWNTHTRFILSHALLRDETYAAPLRDWLGDFAAGALLILDEAHNAAPASGGLYPVESEFTQRVREFAPRFEHRLFLSATPHNGHSSSFSALLEILDPQRFCRGVKPSPKITEPVMVRRLKEDLRQIEGGFPRRDPQRLVLKDLPHDAPELELSRLLADYRTAREQRFAGQPKSAVRNAMFVLISLQKRLLSSPEAFACTLRAHRAGIARRQLAGGTSATPGFAPRDLDALADRSSSDDDRAELPEVEAEAAGNVEAASASAGQALAAETAILDRMTRIAEAARHQPDARMKWLNRWIRANLFTGSRWNDRRVVIFTEYADTKRYLVEQIESSLGDDARNRLLTYHGGMDENAREDVKRAFNADPSEHPVRILVATDAAREGVNLQNHCADLFHFDVPWNPSRMEQRNGRIDRKLQRADVVRCHYFVIPQRAEDRVLDVLIEKTERIYAELGVFPPLLDSLVEKRLVGGIRHADADRLAGELRDLATPRTAVDEDLEPVRARQHALKQQLDVLRKLLEESKTWLGLEDDTFRDAISASLSVLGAPALAAKDATHLVDDPARVPWSFPALDRTAAGHGWAETLDALRVPKRRDQKRADWRRDAPLRPIVFRDPGSLDGKVVHLHLEHRVVQRLLGRFLAQGFVHDDLSRAAVVLTDHPTPYVLVLGRLSLYGDHAARLHDEVLVAAAEWIEPDLRSRKLRPLGDEDKRQTLALLETSLLHARTVPETVRSRLTEIAPRDVDELEGHLRRRAESMANAALRELTKRGEQEAKDMVAILLEQKKRIGETLKGWAEREKAQQMTLFAPEELTQLAADRRHQERRLRDLDTELVSEPERIRAGYVVKARRIEPVGIVYLWPRTG
jgi:superfamily II DNA or RNA helicase